MVAVGTDDLHARHAVLCDGVPDALGLEFLELVKGGHLPVASPVDGGGVVAGTDAGSFPSPLVAVEGGRGTVDGVEVGRPEVRGLFCRLTPGEV